MNKGSQPKRMLILNADSSTSCDLQMKLAGSPFLKVCLETTRAEEVLPSLQEAKPDLVLVDGPLGAEILTLCQQIRIQYPHVSCVVVCAPSELNWEPFLRSMGVWIIPKPIQLSQLEWIAGSLVQHHDPTIPEKLLTRRQTKQFITVYGPKGGVGKTFLSRELAIFFTQQQLAGRPYKVLAVDLNLDLGTFATTLNLPRTPNMYTWAQAINRQLQQIAVRDGRQIDSIGHEEWQEISLRVALTPEEIHQYVVHHEDSGLHVLTSPREIRDSFEIKDYHLYIILETLKRSDYDVILLDTAPDTTDATIQALFFAEKVIMVGNPLVDAIENIHRMLKLLREADYPEERIQICINRLQRKEMYTLEEIRAYFQLHPSKTVFTIPDDEEVKRSINAGKSLVLSTGKSPAKEAIFSLGKSLLPYDDEEMKRRAKPKQSSWISKWVKPFKRGGVH